jgi:hypothetical protein
MHNEDVDIIDKKAQKSPAQPGFDQGYGWIGYKYL